MATKDTIAESSASRFGLTYRQFQIFWMRLKGLPFNTIADRLEISPQCARLTYHRAKMKVVNTADE